MVSPSTAGPLMVTALPDLSHEGCAQVELLILRTGLRSDFIGFSNIGKSDIEKRGVLGPHGFGS